MQERRRFSSRCHDAHVEERVIAAESGARLPAVSSNNGRNDYGHCVCCRFEFGLQHAETELQALIRIENNAFRAQCSATERKSYLLGL